ncbi:hypothetical protein Aph01nite_40620 [Acrocarpospora phusangensis]|uniref:Exo-1,3-beta-glucanase D n=1 Tax=Acrocarpospora phusangensis TaxID=1070424 RepID=A0A919QGF3_9ACTN|nr:discoidin domain-containing protein [Acrocarpospora phusangensis]GIH25752.1 hypothetical protein Aph01nite_40620 [Acrocarpospora phusangensis]
MKRRWPIAALIPLIAATAVTTTARPAAALDSADFLKVSGTVLKKNSGSGATVSLRGTNLGGWLAMEEWMSPLGEFALDRSGWTATASARIQDVTRAFDGDDSTRWSTEAAMNGSEWLYLDLGGLSRFNRLTVNYAGFAGGDFARHLVVEVSPDNTHWTTEYDKAASGATPVTTADFAPVTARYVRVRQTGSAGDWWSVGEINLFNDDFPEEDEDNAPRDSFKRTQWTARTSDNTDASAVLDGQNATRWTTNAGQAPGQWIQLDLHARMTINSVTLDTEKNTTSEDDYPRGYTVQLSNDEQTWTQVASGVGTLKATNINFPARSARYVRVTQTGSSYRWWSIGEMSVSLSRDDHNLQLTLDQRFGRAGGQAIRDAHEDTWITAADFDRIAAMGLNFVRLPIAWTTLLNMDGTWKADPWSKIDWAVQQAANRGMYTLLDLHTVPGGGCPWASCGRVGPSPGGFWGTAAYQDWTEEIWEAIAARYEGDPAVAGYDLINEPLLAIDEDAGDVTRKSAYYDRLYDAVRAIDPDHLIVMGAFFDFDRIAPPSEYGWSNVVYELHPYAMKVKEAHDWTAQNDLVTRNLDDLPGLLADPGVPVLYGEYSLYYYDDVWARWMAGLNARRQSWSNWSYKVRGTDADGQGYWGFYYNRPAPIPVINNDGAATFAQKLRRFGTDTFTENQRLVATVTRYAGGLATFDPVPIDKTDWEADASSTWLEDTASEGIDGDTTTRWSTGIGQAPDQWYQIDLGSPHTIAQVTVETPRDSTSDFPRGFRLEFSMDGDTWTTVGTGIGFGWKRPITVTPRTARFVKITQTGTEPDWWWSIGEVTIYSSY